MKTIKLTLTHSNGIQTIKEYDESLTILNLSSNSISQIEGLEKLVHLTHLNLYNNPIQNPNVIYDTYCYVDEIFSRIKSKKIKDDYTIIKTTKDEWIVGKDDNYSHGETLKSAKDDLVFKILSKNLNVDEIVKKIKSSKKVTVNDYRPLTGACQQGIERFKKEIGLKRNEMKLEDLKEKVKGRYGYKRFMELVG